MGGKDKSPSKKHHRKRKLADKNSVKNQDDGIKIRRSIDVDADGAVKSSAAVRDGDKPEPDNCAVCLGKVTEKSVAEACFHAFCKTCIFEWSKVKPECPVCRTPFDRILFNIKSETEYEQHIIPPRAPLAASFLGVPSVAFQPWAQLGENLISQRLMQLDQILREGLRSSGRSSATSTVSSSRQDPESLFNIGNAGDHISESCCSY